MASMSRQQYVEVFDFAAEVFIYFESTGKPLERASIEIMDMVEACIGQQPNRPDRDPEDE